MDLSRSMELRDSLARNAIFKKIVPEFIEKILSKGKERYFEAGELIIDASYVKPEFYILLDGTVEAFKTDEQRKYNLNTIHGASFFGENILLGETARTVSVRAVERSKVLIIQNTTVEQLSSKNELPLLEFYKALHLQTVEYLRKINRKNIRMAKLQKNLSFFLVNIVCFLSIFAILVPYLQDAIKTTNSIWITTLVIIAGLIFLSIRMKQLQLPLSFLGIRKRNLKIAARDSTIFSIIIILLYTAGKFILIHSLDAFADKHFIYPSYQRIYETTGVYISFQMYFLIIALYIVHSIFQELLVRGAIQGTFKQLLIIHPKISAIFLASLVFSSAHAYFGIACLPVFFQGLFWGWIYERYENIIAPIISHILIGTFVLNIIGPF